MSVFLVLLKWDCCSLTAWGACTLLIFSFSPREAFRGPVYALAIYMVQTEAQREKECAYNIVYYVS